MYQPKVENTQVYEDNQGRHIVTPAKLILRNTSNSNTRLCRNIGISQFHFRDDINYDQIGIEPIIISESEEMKTGDRAWNGMRDSIVKSPIDAQYKDEQHYCKILSFSGQFSNSHLQAIVDGKMEDYDDVLIKCEFVPAKVGSPGSYQIYFDSDNTITLFPHKESMKEAFEKWFYKSTLEGAEPKTSEWEIWKAAVEWEKNNNY